jgi:GcrA cell cycle regulator
MQASDWAPEHCEALRDCLNLGMSFAEIAREINARFGTSYSRSAAIGRSKRMGLVAPKRPSQPPKPARSKADRVGKRSDPPSNELLQAAPARAEPVKLRCVGISPRLISLTELEPGDCRYPYGGDKENEPITFCGHPRLAGSSYCAPHFHLTRGPDADTERPVGPVVLRLVQAA